MKKIAVLIVGVLMIASCGTKKTAQIKTEVVEVEEVVEEKKAPVLTYEVQIGAFDTKKTTFESVENVKVIFEENLYKYRLGSFTNYRKARKYRKTLLKKYPDAFVQALLDGKPISIEEALNRK